MKPNWPQVIWNFPRLNTKKLTCLLISYITYRAQNPWFSTYNSFRNAYVNINVPSVGSTLCPWSLISVDTCLLIIILFSVYVQWPNPRTFWFKACFIFLLQIGRLQSCIVLFKENTGSVFFKALYSNSTVKKLLSNWSLQLHSDMKCYTFGIWEHLVKKLQKLGRWTLDI